jgi:hypothetical protein
MVRTDPIRPPEPGEILKIRTGQLSVSVMRIASFATQPGRGASGGREDFRRERREGEVSEVLKRIGSISAKAEKV